MSDLKNHNQKVELLAPAGDASVMKACFQAGADAVYMGLSRFSARAYAENAPVETYVESIDHAHLFGKRLHLTLNTLLKERELKEEIEPLLRPLYEAGLDAVIVQDVGLMKFISERFPLLSIHASTQETVTGCGAAGFFKGLNVTRIVLPRELSLQEIRKMSEESGFETEVFIHGALCYCYSGQCLFSSLVGGRSGNRGRCAQPCRLPYRFVSDGKESLAKAPYLLSLKDLNTLKDLPQLLSTGVSSLKIEGRMKKAEYAAGVTSVYRKYIDLIESDPERPYVVDPTDEALLFDLFNRQGFTDAYLSKQNAKNMTALEEKPVREPDERSLQRIREAYIETAPQVRVKGTYRFEAGEKSVLSMETEVAGRATRLTVVSEEPADVSASRPLTRAEVEKQLKKTGGTDFVFTELSGTVGDNVFVPVSKLNAFRRDALERFREAVLAPYRRLS